MLLAPIQRHLIEEYLELRIIPCVEQMLDKAPTSESKEVCMYLMLLTLKGTEDQIKYGKKLSEYLGEGNQWLKEKLINMNKLFNAKGDQHIFLKDILDHRFCQRLSGMTEKEWEDDCKNAATEEYRTSIERALYKAQPLIYNKVSAQLSSSQKSTKTEPQEVDGFIPPTSSRSC